ncbi:MAG: hypothetical protein ABS79_00185 [Planctomycetes bacterium SCN 63-9]|nr:MAG: hypothetical protein ABS79_00185 [Planctomycetes bacterium SCN 63-9]
MSSPCSHSLKVFDRWRGHEIASVQTDSQGGAIHTLVRAGVSLRNADLRGFTLNHTFLRGADLRGADLARATLHRAYLRDSKLRGANLRHADLVQTNLQNADLSRADLSHADLSRADLRGANLLGAELQSASLQDAKLDGAILDWRRGTIPAEILRRSAGAPDGQPRLVLDLLVHGERDDLPWLAVVGRHRDAADWAIRLLVPHVSHGDNAPAFLKRMAHSLRTPSRRPAQLPRLSWVRRSPSQ